MKKRICSVLLCAVLALSLTAPAFAAYRDVPAGHWASEDIQYVTERGLFKGTGSDTFGPSEKMSRAMLATVLYRYAGSPAVNATVPYVDVTAGAWYMPGVVWAYQNQIFASVNLSRTVLYPNEDVRRAEFCIMLYNFAKLQGKANADLAAVGQAPFTDMDWSRFSIAGFGPIYNEAEEAMLGWAWPKGIMNGTTDTTINPLGTITRAEVAAMLARFDRSVLGGTETTVQPIPTPETASESFSSTYEYSPTNAEALTEESVHEVLMGLKEIYPTGTLYGAPYVPNSPFDRPYSNCDHCAGWAMKCSDAAFGNLPWRRIDHPNWGDIRVGDLVQFRNTPGGHVVVVLEKTDEYIKVTESGATNKTRWGGQYFKWWLEEQPEYAIRTRYPQ